MSLQHLWHGRALNPSAAEPVLGTSKYGGVHVCVRLVVQPELQGGRDP